MGIVKQRRKRLMAWILTIALGVGLWQSSVYATEGTEEESVSGNEIVEDTNIQEKNVVSDPILETKNPVMPMSTEEISMVAQTVSETGEETEVGSETGSETKSGYSISVEYAEESMLVDEFKSTYSYTGVNGAVNGVTDIVDIVDGSALTLYGSSSGGEHELLSWSVHDSGDGLLESGTGKTITLNKYNWSSAANLKVYWQKILDITIGNERYTRTQTDINTNSTTVPVPEADSSNIYQDGKFFSEWVGESGGAITVEFGSMIYENRTIELKGVYNSMTVPESGTFALTVTDDNYILDPSGTWEVNSDGYTYEGGISFYSDGKEYSFVKTPIAN